MPKRAAGLPRGHGLSLAELRAAGRVIEERPHTGPTDEEDLEAKLDEALGLLGLRSGMEREAMLVPGRRWRCDFVWPEARLVVEVEGAVYANGRHTRGRGFEADCEKYNDLTLRGWKVIRVTAKHIRDGSAIEWILRGLRREA